MKPDCPACRSAFEPSKADKKKMEEREANNAARLMIPDNSSEASDRVAVVNQGQVLPRVIPQVAGPDSIILRPENNNDSVSILNE